MTLVETLKSTLSERWAEQQQIPMMEMAISFAVVCVLAFYVLIIYKQVSKRGFYSQNFAKTLVGLPIITTAIVFAMQVNVLVSLGMVGALSIVRFRNAVKDPLDLLFLFWSISLGIVCGTSVYTIAIFASVMITIVLFVLDFIPNRCNAYILVLNCDATAEEEALMAAIAPYCSNTAVRTRTRKPTSLDLLVELKTKQDALLVQAAAAVAGVKKVSLVAHDGEVRY